MKIKIKKLISAKFGVSLYPDKFYPATLREYGHYSVQVNSIVSVLVLKNNIKEVSEN